MSYKLDIESAKKGDDVSSRITETGAYEGVFTKAEDVKSSKGTRGIEFSFKSDDGATADYITIWTVNSEGKQIFGFNQLMAIMTCLKVKNTDPKKAMVRKYSRELGVMDDFEVDVFPELMNRPIGVILQKEFYTKNDGSQGERMVFNSCFEHTTHFTASEILDKAVKAEKLNKRLPGIMDKHSTNSAPAATSTVANNAKAAGFDAGFNDDIPF